MPAVVMIGFLPAAHFSLATLKYRNRTAAGALLRSRTTQLPLHVPRIPYALRGVIGIYSLLNSHMLSSIVLASVF